MEEYQTDGGSYLLVFHIPRAPYNLRPCFILRLIPLVTPIAVVMRGIIHALPVPFRLDEKQMRIDTTTAHTALREAFANSIIHCAYTVMGNITVDRFFDKIVLSNPGTMLVSKEEFEEGGHSICRNPLIQKMFVFIGVGEKGGSGAGVIAKGWKDNGWKQLPSLKEVTHPDRVEMTLFIPTFTGDKTIENPAITQKSGDKTIENPAITQKSGDKTIENPAITQKSGDKIGDIMKKSIFDYTSLVILIVNQLILLLVLDYRYLRPNGILIS